MSKGASERSQTECMASGWATMIAVIVDVGDRAELAARHAAAQRLGEQFAAADFEIGAVEARHIGEVAGLGQDQLDDAAQRALGEGAELDDQFAQQVFGRAFEAVDEFGRLHERLADRFGDHRLEELFLVLEVEVGEALADAGGFGDVFELGGGKATRDEQVERRPRDLAGRDHRGGGSGRVEANQGDID